MGIAEEHSLGEMLIHVGGIGLRLFDLLVLIRRIFLSQRGAAQHDEEYDIKGEQTSDRAEQSSFDRGFTWSPREPGYSAFVTRVRSVPEARDALDRPERRDRADAVGRDPPGPCGVRQRQAPRDDDHDADCRDEQQLVLSI